MYLGFGTSPRNAIEAEDAAAEALADRIIAGDVVEAQRRALARARAPAAQARRRAHVLAAMTEHLIDGATAGHPPTLDDFRRRWPDLADALAPQAIARAGRICDQEAA